MNIYFRRIINAVIASAFTCYFGVYSLVGGVNKQPPEVPEDFTPVLRFAVCSDVHLSGEEDQANAKRFTALYNDTYDYAASQSYRGFDAVIVAGDMTGGGREPEYEMFMKIINDNTVGDTQTLVCMGNHEFIEYRDYDATIGYDVYKKFVSEDVDTHTVINGYHFIGVSYADDGKTFKSKVEWLKAELDKAVADTPDKPIFVFQHPHPTLTVYGSVNWSDLDIKTTLMKYPQVVDFSGHSHYASCDPRSINQTSFTSVGAGSLGALMSNLDYISGDVDMPGETAAFWLAEVDAEGNLLLKLYDAVSHRFFDDVQYYIPNVANKGTKYYSWGNLRSIDTAPQFPQDAKVSVSTDSEGETVLNFPNAKGCFDAENYRITVKSGAKTVWSDTVVSNYGRADLTEMAVNVGKLDKGEYTVTIAPYSPYSKGGKALTANMVIA